MLEWDMIEWVQFSVGVKYGVGSVSESVKVVGVSW